MSNSSVSSSSQTDSSTKFIPYVYLYQIKSVIDIQKIQSPSSLVYTDSYFLSYKFLFVFWYQDDLFSSFFSSFFLISLGVPASKSSLKTLFSLDESESLKGHGRSYCIETHFYFFSSDLTE